MSPARRLNRAVAKQQMAMARTVKRLKTKEAKRAQVHALCESLKTIIRESK